MGGRRHWERSLVKVKDLGALGELVRLEKMGLNPKWVSRPKQRALRFHVAACLEMARRDWP